MIKPATLAGYSDQYTVDYERGPVSVAKFQLGEGVEPEQRETRVLRQRQVSDLIGQLLARLATGDIA